MSMQNSVVYVTGNAHKARYFSDMTGLEIQHEKADLEEIQSLNLSEIIEHKVRQAYVQLQCPVIVEDTKLSFRAMGGLPGSFIKFFIEQMSFEAICNLLDSFDDRTAFAGAAIAYFDGSTLEIFERELEGTIANEPRGDNGFGWNRIFIPKGSSKTLGEMDDATFKEWYGKIKPFNDVSDFLKHKGD